MSSLPQRKKSAEEIAQLRETLGVPYSPAASPTQVDETPAPAPAPPPAPAKGPMLEFKKIIQPRTAAAGSSSLPPFAPPPSRPQVVKTRRLRSFKKSEQAPVIVPRPVKTKANSPIPVQRRSNEEIEEMRKRETLTRLDAPAPNPKLIPAHPALISCGYLLPATGAACFIYDSFPWIATAACATGGLALASLIFLHRPISKHHAGFISAMTVMLIVFGTLHHFPQLQHAS